MLTLRHPNEEKAEIIHLLQLLFQKTYLPENLNF